MRLILFALILIPLLSYAQQQEDIIIDDPTGVVSVQDSQDTSDLSPGEVFMIVEKMPEYPGGQDAMYKYLGKVEYPEVAKDQDIQGKVYARFVVGKDGTVGNIDIIRGLHPSLDSAVVNHLKGMPKWEPGTQRGKPVRVSFTLPINFTLK